MSRNFSVIVKKLFLQTFGNSVSAKIGIFFKMWGAFARKLEFFFKLWGTFLKSVSWRAADHRRVALASLVHVLNPLARSINVRLKSASVVLTLAYWWDKFKKKQIFMV